MDSLVEHGDLVSVDDQLVTLSLDLAVEAAMGGVILEHVDLKKGGVGVGAGGGGSGRFLK